ncbi:SusC/RagA family TonB-linked outer membrane protein [Chitinophagaceae bacterium LB-8]|uniref:SusC/RagA family TonB-linked outer membrane protein n=1 Tax=Paraflavisolibacter caeni TaxID=2982496 RepID=A0A9X3BEW1_9BACT|nr:SusC/RagA family TonB-linked outer membrane protein [Paraflavisolibacter caeni]MCU7547779.1 SusC/RagA family TonB-linked outer membrane protein [Paraflavisolibacter caeni]
MQRNTHVDCAQHKSAKSLFNFLQVELKLFCHASYILFALMLLISFSAYSQTTVISGLIKDESGKPISGASVKVVQTKTGTLSDEEGRFSINMPAGQTVLEVSYVGFATEKIKIVGQRELAIVLRSTNKVMDEIVVVGVQRQSKRSTTSAISTVTGKAIENMPAPSVDGLLQGRVAGMNVQITSGEPGVTPTIVVRGNSKVSTDIGNSDVAQSRALSSPLYVIDGVPTNTSDIDNAIGTTGTNYLAGININDIAEVVVQKDATATAAWGSRGANGVIYITTKKGRSGTPEFRLNSYVGVTQRPQLLKTLTGAEERREKMNILNSYLTPTQIASIVPQILTDSLNPSYNHATDWQGLFYRTGMIKNIDGSVSAATSNLNYRVSFNYYDEQGIIQSFGFKRYSLRGNFDFRISPKLNTQLVIGLSRGERLRGMKYNNSDNNTPVSGSSVPSSFYGLNAGDSSLFLGVSSQLRNQNINDQLSASLNFNYDILPSLKYNIQGSANISSSYRDYFQPSRNDKIASVRPAGSASYAESNKGSYNTLFFQQGLNYTKTLATNAHQHSLVATASQQFSRDITNSNWVSGYNIPSNDIQVVSGVAQADMAGGSSYAASGLLSVLGQVQYDLDKKYMLYLSYRGDASSRFGANSKWGYFPATGLGWVVSDEKFMSRFSGVIDYLKLRASYGVAGTNSGDFYAPYNSYELGGYYNGVQSVQPSYSNGLTKNDLTWTKTIQKNLGMDLFLLKSRLNIMVDVYDKLSKDDYYQFALPFFTGYSDVQFNAHDLWVSNRGVDITLGANILPENRKLHWGTQLTLSHNQNLIAKLPNNNRTFVITDAGDISRIYSVGQPVYEMFQIKYLGVYNYESEIPFNPLTGKKVTYFKGNHVVVPGDPKWLDLNKDFDVWSGEDNGDQYGDRMPTGNPNPKFTGGWVNDFSYKNLSLSIVSVFTLKRDVYNTYFQSQIANITGGYSSSMSKFAENRLPDLTGIDYWTPAKAAAKGGYQASFPTINPALGSYYQYIAISDMFVTDGSYFKVKTISLGYEMPPTLLKKIKLKKARVYSMLDNVLTLKNSSMPNPELVDQLGVYTGGLYPVSKKLTIGLDITF